MNPPFTKEVLKPHGAAAAGADPWRIGTISLGDIHRYRWLFDQLQNHGATAGADSHAHPRRPTKPTLTAAKP